MILICVDGEMYDEPLSIVFADGQYSLCAEIFRQSVGLVTCREIPRSRRGEEIVGKTHH